MQRYKTVLKSGFILMLVAAFMLIVYNIVLQRLIEDVLRAFLSLDAGKRAELGLSFASSIVGTFVGAIFALVVALVQFSIQASSESRQRRLETALEFYRELVSSEFTQAREESINLFIKCTRKKSNLDAFFKDLKEDEKHSIWEVIFFFRRLQLVIECNRIDYNLVKKCLGGNSLDGIISGLTA
jgi:hypothetical protein